MIIKHRSNLVSTKVIFVIIPFFLFVLLRLPSLFEPYWYGDEGIYACVAQEISRGKILYQDIWDNKPPHIYLTYLLAGDLNRQLWVRFLNLIAGIFTLIGLYKMLSKISNSKWVIWVITVIAAIILGSPAIEGNIANGENFLLPFTVWAIYLAWNYPQSNGKKIVVGLFFAIAALYKLVSMIDFATVMLFLVITGIHPLPKKLNLRQYIPYLLGSLIPFTVVIIYELLTHNFINFFQTTVLDMFAYVSWTDNTNVNLVRILLNDLKIKLGFYLLSLLLFSLLYVKNRISPRTYFIALLYSSEILIVFMSNRFYPHYLLLLLPSWIMLTSLLIEMLAEKRWQIKQVLLSLFILFFLSFPLLFFGHKPTEGFSWLRKYYQYFVEYHMTKKIGFAEYDAFFNHEESHLITLGNSLAQNFSSINKNSTYFYTDHGWTYDYLNYPVMGPFCVSYHRYLKKDGNKLLMDSLIASRPSLIVVEKGVSSFTEFDEYLQKNYNKSGEDTYYSYFLLQNI